MMRAAIWAALMFWALLAHGCAGASERESQPAWEAARVREQWPGFATEPACITAWVIDGDGCGVSADGTTVEECASGPDPYVMLAVPDRFGTCKIGLQDCEEGTCEK